MVEELITIPPFLHQEILRLVGLADSTLLGNDLYYRIKVVEILREFLGEELISKKLNEEGKSWDKIKKQLEEVSEQLSKIKPTYDLIEDKKFSKTNEDVDNKERFIREVSKIPLIENPVMFMYVWFIKRTNLQRFTVPSENYKILEHSGYKTFFAPKKTTGEVTQQTQQTTS